mgnify:CR=1 FL=1
MELQITNCPNQEDDDFVINKTREYNDQFITRDPEALSIYFRNESNDIIAGLTGKSYFAWLHIDFLWVDENHREHKLGSKLMAQAEKEAIKRNCNGITLDTFSFQARGFYEKMGFEVCGEIAGYAQGHTRFYLKKVL